MVIDVVVQNFLKTTFLVGGTHSVWKSVRRSMPAWKVHRLISVLRHCGANVPDET